MSEIFIGVSNYFARTKHRCLDLDQLSKSLAIFLSESLLFSLSHFFAMKFFRALFSRHPFHRSFRDTHISIKRIGKNSAHSTSMHMLGEHRILPKTKSGIWISEGVRDDE